jgi:photosystem II stability/assembly factor-like uncharacterized protein
MKRRVVHENREGCQVFGLQRPEASHLLVLLAAFLAGCGSSSTGDGGQDGEADGEQQSDADCREREPHEYYCLWEPDSCRYEPSFCSDGDWVCQHPPKIHPPAMPEFEDWAWRCGILKCYAQGIPITPTSSWSPTWREPEPYSPPDPTSLTGRWRLVADCDDIVPIGCERQSVHFSAARALAVDPINPDVMYVGMVVNQYVGTYWVSGVFKSVDGGESWFEARSNLGSPGCTTMTGHGSSVRFLFIDPDDPRVLFASMNDCGLYRTRDGADLWEVIWSIFDCGTPGPVGKDGRGTYYASCIWTLFFSQDGGTTWDARAPVRLGTHGRHITALAFDKRLPDRVWVGMGIGSRAEAGEGYLFRSDDNGYTWTELGQDLDAECRGGGAVLSLALCEANPDLMAASVYACGLFLSDDGGMSWRRAGAPLDGWYNQTSAYAPLPERCSLYAGGSYFSTFRSDDNGHTWTREPVAAQLDDFFFNPYVPEVMGGIVVEQGSSNAPFELWVRE